MIKELKTTRMYKAIDGNSTWYIEQEDVTNTTYQDMIDAGYGWLDMGLSKIEGDYDSMDDYQFELGGQVVKWADIKDTEIDNDWLTVRYHDGNNWHTDTYDCQDLEAVEVQDILNRPDSSPAYVLNYTLVLADGTRIDVYKHNVTGNIKPYYYVEDDQ